MSPIPFLTECSQSKGTSRPLQNLNGIRFLHTKLCGDYDVAKPKVWITIKFNAVSKSMGRTCYLLRLLDGSERRMCLLSVANASLGYFLGGFGGMLSIAAIICLICYKPLGLPNPDGSDLALGILLFVVVIIQGVFNAWQDWVHISRSAEI